MVMPLIPRQRRGEDDPRSHPFGDVVDGHRQHHHVRVAQMGLGALWFFRIEVQMGGHDVDRPQEADAERKPDDRRDEVPLAVA
jgi:hypothetical protein